VEFPSRKIENLIKRVTEENRFEEKYSRYAIFGLCRTCAKKQRSAENLNEKVRL
jgi:Fe2+ or Zn2+ uptake regulation protein